MNVDGQERNPSSFHTWMQRLIAVRRTARTFGRGSITLFHPTNHRVFAYVRSLGPEDPVILVVCNFGSTAQAAELDLSLLEGAIPVEMFGGSIFPRIGAAPYLLTLGPYGYYWFRLRWI